MTGQPQQAIEWRQDVATGAAIIDDQHSIPEADLDSFITNRLTDHILHIDKDLGAFIRDEQARAAAAKD